MNLYLLRRIDQVDYDQYEEILVRATNQDQAYKIAQKFVLDDHKHRYNDGLYFNIENIEIMEIKQNGNPGVIISSFISG